jgi:hypothetical protein
MRRWGFELFCSVLTIDICIKRLGNWEIARKSTGKANIYDYP